MQIWIIADTHFWHTMLGRKGYRPLDFTERIIANWQRLVNPEDTVLHLGDVILGRNSTLLDIMTTLPGTKFLIRGNHDSRAGWFEKRGFAFVCDQLVRGDVLFTHEPVPHTYRLNVHGHCHGNSVNLPWYDYNRYREVVIEKTLSPIALKDVIR